jgi:hypothetical protein
MRPVLADEAAPVSRREIVAPLFDNNKSFLTKEKRKENRDG